MDERFLSRMAGTRRHAGTEPFCLYCGYDMRGTPSGRCPECGAVFERKHWERSVDEILQKVFEAEDAAAMVPVALTVLVFGMILRLTTLLFGGVGSVWNSVGKFGGAACGVLGLLLLMGLVRHRRLPPWAKAKQTIRASPAAVMVGVTLGVLLLITALVAPW